MLKKQNKKQKTRDTKSYLDTPVRRRKYNDFVRVFKINSGDDAVYAGKGGLLHPFQEDCVECL
jgi:hypothetical protein